MRRHQLGVEYDATARYAVILDVKPEINDALAHQDDALDHPIERSAVEHLLATARRLQSAMAVLRRLAGALEALQLLCLPVFELLHRVAADAQLDEMDGHSQLILSMMFSWCYSTAPVSITQPQWQHFPA